MHKSTFFSKVYYTFFSSAFDREFQAVLSGKAAYFNLGNSEEANVVLLTRNIHRIEKGLLMKPRRQTFATKFIGETVHALKKTLASHPGSGQLSYYQDVLTAYFEATEESQDPTIVRSREQYAILSSSKQASIEKKVPYRRTNKQPITFEDFYRLCKRRRSVRWFTDQPVDRGLIDKAIEAANQSPSACNRQPFRYVIIDDPTKLAYAVKLPMGTAGYSHSITALIVCVGNLAAYFDERDRHLIYIDGSLANMALMFALETLGLSSVPINWPDIEDREEKMEKFLGLAKFERPIMCIGIGYPDLDELVAYSDKKPLGAIRVYK